MLNTLPMDEISLADNSLADFLQCRLSGIHELIEFSSRKELEILTESICNEGSDSRTCDGIHPQLVKSNSSTARLEQDFIHELVVKCLTTGSGIESFELGNQTLVAIKVAPLPCEHINSDSQLGALVSLVSGPSELVCNSIRLAIESWELQQQVRESEAATQESAMQLAQSYEEQTWLRGFAHNVSNFSRVNGANELARGIIAPLPYLLSAQAIYLLVDESEQKRSGLSSTVFGQAEITLEDIGQLLEQAGIDEHSLPHVRNYYKIETPNGEISSLLSVPVKIHNQFSGYLVGINRSMEFRADGMPLYDPEFGSNGWFI